MNTTPITTSNAREQALEGAAEALRRVADALHLLAVTEPAPAGLRLAATTREPEVLLTVQEAADLLRCSVRHIERLVAGKPCRRRAGRRVLIERAGLLALTRRN
jgi:excisionase family DNA binding protein